MDHNKAECTPLFGTDGIRGLVGISPFTRNHIIHLADTIAGWLLAKSPHPHVLILHDTRSSCDWIKAALKTSFLSHGIAVHDAGILPTPAAMHLLKTHPLDYAFIISGSHNPGQYNGIKIMSPRGKITTIEEDIITKAFIEACAGNTNPPCPNYQQLERVHTHTQAAEEYIKSVCSHFSPDLLCGKKIIIDCGYGATATVVQSIFKRLGANIIALNTTPNGTNINQQVGSLYPHTLQTVVCQENAYAGFAFDGDGDRVIAVTQEGNIKDGDDMLAMLSQHADYAHQRIIAGTVMSNSGLEQFLTAHGKQLYRTSVGDRHIAAYLNQHNYILGGEPSGHIILNDIIPAADSISTALRLLEYIDHSGNLSMQTFEKSPQMLTNIRITNVDLQAIEQLTQEYRCTNPHPRILIRKSGTEPVLRIMVEAPSQEEAQELTNVLVQKIKHM